MDLIYREDNPVQRRNAGRAGVIANAARLGRFAWQNRNTIRNYASRAYRTAQSIAREARRFTNRANMARTNYKLSNPKSAYKGGGGKPPRKYGKFKSKRRPARGGARGKRRFTKSVGPTKKLYNTLYPLKTHTGNCFWRAEVDNTAFVGYTSMEVGNYHVNSGYALGTSCQSTFIAKPISNASRATVNGGSINQCIDGPLVAEPDDILEPRQKRYLENQHLTIQLQNSSNNVAHIAAYTCKWRRDEATSGRMTLEAMFRNGLTDAGVSDLNGVTPFMLPTFTSNVKILRTQKVKLNPGENTYFKCMSPLKGTHSFEALTDSGVTARYTRGILFVFYGGLVHDSTAGQAANVSTGPCALNIKAAIKVGYRVITQEKKFNKVSNHQVNGVTAPEVNPMNYNNPAPYAE